MGNCQNPFEQPVWKNQSQPKANPTIRADAPPCMDTASGALRELHLLTPIFEAEYAAVPLHWLATGYLATGFSPPQNFYLVIPDKSDGLKFDASKPPTDRPTDRERPLRSFKAPN